jgi:hypothetical protein
MQHPVSLTFLGRAANINSPAPATPNAHTVNLIENTECVKLTVDRVLPPHGRMVPAAGLHAAAGRTIPR